MVRTDVLFATSAWLLLASLPAAAQTSLYSCTTTAGKNITADLPPPECWNRPIKELRPDGSTRRVIEPPLSPAQQAAREAEERRQNDEAEKRRAQMRKDVALLETYGSEQDIEEARVRAVATREVVIERAHKRMDDLKGERRKLEDEKEFYTKRDMPEKLKRSFAGNAEAMQQQEKVIADANAEKARVNARFEAERQRFRELVTAGATPAQRKK
jgi:hypothetical protein